MVVSRLESAGIDYLITGSFALAVHATPRMTRDIDVVIDCTPAQAEALAASFQDVAYASVEAARDAADAATMFNVIHNETLLKVDFIFRKHDAYSKSQFSRRHRVDLGGFSATFISAEDLILAKLLWRRDTGSEQQLKDILSIMATASGLDRSYVDSWAKRLELHEEWRQIATA